MHKFKLCLCLPVLLLLFFTHATQGALTVVPSNQVTVNGTQVTFPCSVSYAAVSWTFYPVVGQGCIVFNGFGMGLCASITRYSVSPQTGGQYNLYINNTQMSDAGTFVCTDLGGTNEAASAVYGVIGSGTTVTSNISQSCLFEGDQVSLTCRATYNGSNLMPLLLTWRTSTGQVVTSSMTNNTGLFTSTIVVTASTSDILPHTCTVTFAAPTGDTTPTAVPQPTQATNAPTYTSVATSPAYAVQHCPRTITVTLTNGAEFTGGSIEEGTDVMCLTDGGCSSSYTSYQWTNSSNGVVLSYCSNIAIPAGIYGYTCTAYSAMNCGGGNTKPCNHLQKNISGTAYPVATTRSSNTYTTLGLPSTVDVCDCDCDRSECNADKYLTSTIVLGVLFSIATISTIVLSLVVAYLIRQIKDSRDSTGKAHVASHQQNFTDLTTSDRQYESLHGRESQNLPAEIYRELQQPATDVGLKKAIQQPKLAGLSMSMDRHYEQLQLNGKELNLYSPADYQQLTTPHNPT